jgi:hypothetical protein
MKQKSPGDVRGKRIKCVNFIQCPMCYGCRNSKDDDPECIKCNINKKLNVCNTQLHKTDLIAKMIKRDTIKIDEPVIFKNREYESR